MKRLLSIAVALILGLELNAQYTSFEEVEGTISKWLENYTTIPQQKIKAKKNSITFNLHGYNIEGYFTKGILTTGQTVVIYNTENTPCEILKGQVSYIANRLVVTGVWHKNTTPDSPLLYGSFYVSNTPTNEMVYKDKKASQINIQPKDVLYYRSSINDRPAILETGAFSYIYLGGEDGYLRGKLKNYVEQDKDTYDLAEYMMSLKDNVYIIDKHGETYTGSVLPEKNEKGEVILQKRSGLLKTIGDNAGSKEVSTYYPYVIFEATGAFAGTSADRIVYYVKDTPLFQWDSCWIPQYYFDHCDKILIEFDNGDKYEGTTKILSTESIDGKQTTFTYLYLDGTYTDHNGNSFTGKFDNGLQFQGIEKYSNGDRFEGSFAKGLRSKGTYYYKNGDKFEGKFEKGTYGTLYTDGTTFFIDGTKSKGVWFSHYNLTEQQFKKIFTASNPTEAKKLAEKYEYNNEHITYTVDGPINHLTYMFDPKRGVTELIGIRTIYYDKTKGLYQCVNHDGAKIVDLVIDNKGRHIRETIYRNDKPQYINVITYYSNGYVESVKSYHYDTSILYTSCNFFSDGIVRSAYEYGIGNNGKVIAIKSKEAHPTIGGYTCKLYDLNGNYERSIEWSFGESGLLFTSPEHVKLEPLDLSEFKIVDSE